ncbi:MAG TPA: metallophosphoesterase [Gemmatimonadales bacterium]|nr:metallophosphoesterase [Gemmatimonadales bacterium]
MSRRLFWRAVALTGALACAGSPQPQPQPVPVLAPESIATTLYLIGDAGDPDTTEEPVLEALRRDLASRSSERVVVFLGDNAYPRGLPAPGRPGRRAAELSLTRQIETITQTGSRGFLIPGNHDWAKHGVDGWDAIRRQEAFVDSAGKGTVSFEPGGGCPGPVVADIGTRLRLVLLDSQWWLHPGPKPRHPESSCTADSEEEVVAALGAAVSDAAGRMVVVTQHHPLVSGGIHGGYFGWRDHLFPLRAISSSLWIPIPLLGSLYPAARLEGISSQDIESRAYQRMIAAFHRGFRPAPPALDAAGHEHNLQVIEGSAARFQVVSGAGIYGHTSRVSSIAGTVFAREASGFARLEIPRKGPARLGVLVVDSEGASREVFSTWVE